MELISIDNTRVVYLYHLATPAGAPLPFFVLDQIKQRYSFMVYPKTYEEVSADKVEFRQGEFAGARIDLVEFYNDGLIVSSKANTSVIDAFLEDIESWVSNDLGFKVVRTHRIPKIYESYLIVRISENVWKSYDSLRPVQELIAKSVKDECGVDSPFSPLTLIWSADMTTLPGLKPIPFRLERRAGIAFDLGIYFSSAPLRTNTHIEMLRSLESLVQ